MHDEYYVCGLFWIDDPVWSAWPRDTVTLTFLFCCMLIRLPIEAAPAGTGICCAIESKFSCEFMNMLGAASFFLLIDTVVRWLNGLRGSDRGPGFVVWYLIGVCADETRPG